MKKNKKGIYFQKEKGKQSQRGLVPRTKITIMEQGNKDQSQEVFHCMYIL